MFTVYLGTGRAALLYQDRTDRSTWLKHAACALAHLSTNFRNRDPRAENKCAKFR